MTKRNAITASLTLMPVALAALLSAGCGAHTNAALSGQPAAPEVKTRAAPHIIFISLDTCRADYLGCYGHPWMKTPNLDAFASESILYEHCETVAPTTLCSHTAMFTGQYPHTHGVPRNGFSVHEDNRMLPELLREAGYCTAGFPSATPLFSCFNFSQGFDYYQEDYPAACTSKERKAQDVTDAVLKFVDESDSGKPLFLFIHYWDIHAPYAPPSPYSSMYEEQNVLNKANTLSFFSAAAKRANSRTNPLFKVRQYAGEISYVDEHAGRLLRGLKERNILDSAVTLIVSDHGETLIDHVPYFEHGLTLFDATTHVVCMFRLPQARNAGTRVPGLISNIDVMPTLLAQAGLTPPENIAGRALNLDEPLNGATRDVVFSQATKPYDNLPGDERWFNLSKARSIRGKNYLLINTPRDGTLSLFNWRADPKEMRDLLFSQKPNAGIVRARNGLSARLESWAQECNPLPTENIREDDEELDEQLNALGYLN